MRLVKIQLVVVALATLLLSSCSSGSTTDQGIKTESPKASPSTSETTSKKPATFIDYDADIVLAKDQIELEFLRIALASCKKAQEDGFIVKDYDGDVSYFLPAAEGLWPYWPFDEVTVSDGQIAFAKYFNYPPSLFDPCDLEREARHRQAEDVGIEHKLVRIDENTYAWSQHQGGYSLEKTTYQIKNGLISGYFAEDWSAGISYGPLTSKQLELFTEYEQ